MEQKSFANLISRKNTLKKIVIILPIVLLILWISVFFSIHKIVGNSMSPTMESGSRVLLKRSDTIQRYDVIAFKGKEEKGLVKRVLGMPGDRYIIVGNQIHFTSKNDQFNNVSTSYTLSNLAKQDLAKYSEIPEDYYFVVGDNLNVSSDSREFGWVTKEKVTGKVCLTFFSKETTK